MDRGRKKISGDTSKHLFHAVHTDLWGGAAQPRPSFIPRNVMECCFDDVRWPFGTRAIPRLPHENPECDFVYQGSTKWRNPKADRTIYALARSTIYMPNELLAHRAQCSPRRCVLPRKLAGSNHTGITQ